METSPHLLKMMMNTTTHIMMTMRSTHPTAPPITEDDPEDDPVEAAFTVTLFMHLSIAFDAVSTS